MLRTARPDGAALASRASALAALRSTLPTDHSLRRSRSRSRAAAPAAALGEPVAAGAGASAFVSASRKAHPAGERAFRWQEVAEHRSAASAWVIVDGGVYDVTPLLDRHPGGREMLLLAAGRECTHLFNSYHWQRPDAPRAWLAKYRVGHLAGPSELPAYAPDTAGFYDALSASVRAYFAETGEDPKGVRPGLARLALILAVFVASFVASNSVALPLWGRLAAAAVFGVFQAMPLLHAMHDASHAAIGHSEAWWQGVGRFCLDGLAGGLMISWHHQHVVGHHVYTNVFMADPDVPYVPAGDARYLDVGQKWGALYEWQWLYLPLVYGVLGFRTRLQDVFSTWLAEDCGPVRVNFYGSALLRVVLTKAVWAAWRVLVPLLVWRVPAGSFWACFALAEAVTGYWLAWNFEVSHVADTVLWPQETTPAAAPGKPAGEVGNAHSTREELARGGQRVVPWSWAEAQVRTSVDYGHGGWATWWSGALNYQIEHHLFPGVSQYHYPALAPRVRAVCEKFGVPYRYEPTFWAAWTAHVRMLYKMGREGRVHHVD